MRILVTVDPEIPVPPVLYGGIERIVSSLIQAYSAKGHEVFLLANSESNEKAAAEIIGWKGTSSVRKSDIVKNARQLKKEYKRIKPDVIHSFSRLLYLYPTIFSSKVPVIQTYQREISKKSTGLMKFFAGKKIHFTACGEHMFQTFSNKSKWTGVHNFTDTNYFIPDYFRKKEHLFFLGRIEDIKGTYEAILAAKKTNEKLIIAGNIPPEHQIYYKEKVEPYLEKGKIEYVGAVNDEQKLDYLQSAKALIFPIKWAEPFGIVMAEAMACACPVVAFNRGSVEEVVKNGENGFKTNNLDELCEAIKNLDKINPEKVRDDAENRFSLDVIADKYLQLLSRNF